MTNPFEDQNGTYHVLMNEEGQYSLWPSFIEIPSGWSAALQSSSRQCVALLVPSKQAPDFARARSALRLPNAELACFVVLGPSRDGGPLLRPGREER